MNMHNRQDEEAKFCLISNLLSLRYREEGKLAELKREFAREKFVKLPGVFIDEAFRLLRDEMDRLGEFAVAKDFIMGGYNTPRVMHVLGGQTLLRESPIIWAVYIHGEIWSLVQTITGARIYPSIHPDGFMGANYLLDAHSTQGWHLDDEPYTLVYAFDAPSPEDGGKAEFVQNWPRFCDERGVDSRENVEPLVDIARSEGLVRTAYLAPGDGYLMKANECLHRVAPLHREGTRRMVLAVGYMDTPMDTPDAGYDHTYSDLYG